VGREFVYQLERKHKFDEIWVIARSEEKLNELKNELSTSIKVMSLDLLKQESFERYKEILKNENPEIAVLVNASGAGRFGSFSDISLEEHFNTIVLNDKSLVAMTYLSLPYMKSGSCIYQLGSLSSFQPVPYINIYGASKAFVLSFSRALNVELKSRGIRVMAVCPGWVKTNFFDHAVVDNTITYFNRFYTSEQVVTRAIRDMEKGKDLSICGFPVRGQVFFTKLLPHKLVMKIWCRQQKK